MQIAWATVRPSHSSLLTQERATHWLILLTPSVGFRLVRQVDWVVLNTSMAYIPSRRGEASRVRCVEQGG